MRAAFTDSQGPRLWRFLPYAGTVAALAFAAFGPLETPGSWALGLLAFAAFHLLGVVSLRQRAPRTVEIEARPGVVEVKRAGTRSQRIQTKDIVGATTARTAGGIVLSLQHRLRDQPIVLQVETDADAAKVRQALGIGHGGFGTVAWRTLTSSDGASAVICRAFAAAVSLVCMHFVLFGAAWAPLFGAMWLLTLVPTFIGVGALLTSRPAPSIVMTPYGLQLRTAQGPFFLPYHAIHGVEEHRTGVAFRVPPPYHRVGVQICGPAHGGLTKTDRAMMLAQIEAASLRARGLGPEKNDPSARIEILRRNGESARDWLLRLDMQAHLLGAGGGYRGTNLEIDDLWTILEDPEADPELRGASARILRHLSKGDVRPRIDAAVAAVRDDGTSRRLRIALSDDVDAASEELETIDARERPRYAARL